MKGVGTALILLVAVVGAAALLWLRDGGDAPAPPPGATLPNNAAANPTEPQSPTAAERAGVSKTPANLPSSGDASPASNQAAGDATSEPATTGNIDNASNTATVQLRVRRAVDQIDVPAFRWRFTAASQRIDGTGEAGRASADLPAGATGTLLVEADGLQPLADNNFTVPQPTDPTAVIDVFLTPLAQATGITLLVKDLAQRPIEHVRVDAFRITNDNRDGWHLGPALWQRRTTANDGRYELPALAPGEYGILLVATDADGELLPLSPYRRAFTLTGSNGFVEDVPLEPACVLLLELIEPNGQALDPDRHGPVTIGLRLAGGPKVQRKWVAKQRAEAGSERSVAAIDRLPAAGLAWPAEPLPPGGYTLEVFVNGDPRLRRPVTLTAGERQTVRVIVP